MGERILASQERRLQSWSIPLTGYFYSNERHETLFQRFHVGEEQAPIVALTRLCSAFPDNPSWMKWYSAIVLHSKYYLERASEVNQPYGVLPAAIYRESDARMAAGKQGWTPLRAADSEAYVAEVRQGVPLGGEYFLRRFPVWFDFRGNFSVLLSAAKALSTAARLRGDIGGIDLAEKQAEWVAGRNPFAAGIMYGEGRDWTPLYSVRSGQIVGALPVGIETKGFHDAPYWPNQICWTYKEVWVHPVGRWIWLMEDVAGPAVVTGTGSAEPVEVREEPSGAVHRVTPVHGSFRLSLARGRYLFRQGQAEEELTALAGGVYHVDLRPGRWLRFESSASPAAGDLALRVSARGAGRHAFTLRTSNLAATETTKEVDLRPGQGASVVWHAHVEDASTPWVAVIIADGQMDTKQELTGTASEAPSNR